MDRNAAAFAYRSNDVADASPVRSVGILYDKAIEALRTAQNAIDTGDIQTRWQANRKASDILLSLSACLDHDRGGEIAENLSTLYQFMIVRLTRVDIRNDKQAAEDVIGLLEPLRKSWHQLADQIEADPSSVEIPDIPRPAAAPGAAAAPAYPAAEAPRKTEGAQITV